MFFIEFRMSKMICRNIPFSRYWPDLSLSSNYVPVLGKTQHNPGEKDLIFMALFQYSFTYLAPGTASFSTQI